MGKTVWIKFCNIHENFSNIFVTKAPFRYIYIYKDIEIVKFSDIFLINYMGNNKKKTSL